MSKMVSIRDADQYCFDCNKKFKDREALLIHNNTCHQHEDNSCPFDNCDEDFDSSDYLDKHIERHHGVETGRIFTTEKNNEKELKIVGDDLEALMREYIIVEDDAYIIKEKNFLLVHNVGKKIAKFSFETKTAKRLVQNVKRTGNEEYKPYEPLKLDQYTDNQIRDTAYEYEAGHIVPANFNRESQEDMEATMIYPNLAAMHRAINLGLWKSCEYLPKKLLAKDSLWNRLLIISGPVIDESSQLKTVGRRMVYIPVEFFKIYIMLSGDRISKMECFLFPNERVYDNIYRYLTDLKTITAKTRIRFTKKAKSIGLRTKIKEAYNCTKCHKVFLVEAEFAKHEKTHTGIKCKFCRKYFSDSKTLREHKLKAHKQHKCPQCPKIFFEPSKLKAHMAVHSNKKPFKCDVKGCKKAYKSEKNLKEHKKTHADKTFECRYCDEKFTLPHNLRNHIRVVHKVNPASYRRRSVKIVGSAAASSAPAQRISDVVPLPKPRAFKKPPEYKKPRPFVCKFKGCGKRFESQAALKTHMYTHTGEKPFGCQFCDFKTTQKGNLKYHLEHMHAEKKLVSSSPKTTGTSSSSVPAKAAKIKPVKKKVVPRRKFKLLPSSARILRSTRKE